MTPACSSRRTRRRQADSDRPTCAASAALDSRASTLQLAQNAAVRAIELHNLHTPRQLRKILRYHSAYVQRDLQIACGAPAARICGNQARTTASQRRTTNAHRRSQRDQGSRVSRRPGARRGTELVAAGTRRGWSSPAPARGIGCSDEDYRAGRRHASPPTPMRSFATPQLIVKVKEPQLSECAGCAAIRCCSPICIWRPIAPRPKRCCARSASRSPTKP